MENQKLKELAETLKNSGLAVSEYEAMEKAKAIMGTDIQNKERKEPIKSGVPEKIIEQATSEKQEEKKEHEKEGFISHLREKFHNKKKPEPEKHKFSEPDYDISKEDLTVNDLMREVGVNPEEISGEKEKIKDVEEKISEIREEIFGEEKKPEEGKVEEIKHKVEEIKEEVEDIEKEESVKQENKKIDLSKVFDFSERE